jgi:DedD protein
MRLPFLRSKSDSPASAPAPKSRGRAAPVAANSAADEGSAVDAARTQARRRLIGAVVLLAVGVVGFPVLFETKPRPLAVDTPIDASRADTAGGRVVSGPVTSQRTVPGLPADAGNEVPLASAASATSATPVTPVMAPPASAAVPAPQPVASAPVLAAQKAAAASAPATPAIPAKPPKPAPAKPQAQAEVKVVSPAAAEAAASAPLAPRYVVQVGAFNDNARMRDARQKVERAGYKTYTSEVDTPTGRRTRVRLGPFGTKKEAETAAAKVKTVGLPANVLTL